ncbi:MAG: malonyl-CoA decarboxylase [Candidatus Fonsibacter ubiquis]|nr:malonyl-CoA decarboxylase [Candidatus Fonsibacter ubiquis]
MLGLKKFLNFIADRSKGLFLNLFTKKKDSTSHLTDLCDQLISEDGVVSGITIAREIWQLYEKLSLEEKEIFFLQIDKKYKPNYSIIVKACKVFIDKNNETNLEILNEATEGKRQELIRRLNLAPNGTQYLVKMREDLIYFLNKHPELKSLDKDFRHLFRSWFNPGFLKLTRIKKDTDPDILQKIIKNERVHEIKSIEALYRRLENDRLFYAYFHPILDKEPLIFVQVAFTKGVGNSIQAITEGDLSNVDDYDSVTFYSISNSNKGLQQITLGNFLIKRVVFEIQQEFPKVKQFYTLSPIPGFASWFLKQPEVKIKNILKNYNSSQLYFLEKFNDRPLNGVANFHLNNGASIYDIVINADLSSNGYKESFGIMVNYYYELEKIVKNHEDFVNKGKISIMNNLKEHV